MKDVNVLILMFDLMMSDVEVVVLELHRGVIAMVRRLQQVVKGC